MLKWLWHFSFDTNILNYENNILSIQVFYLKTVGDMLKTVYIDRTSYIDDFVYMLTIGNSQTQIVLSCFI